MALGIAVAVVALIGAACSVGPVGSGTPPGINVGQTGGSTTAPVASVPGPSATTPMLLSGASIVTGMHACGEAVAGTDTPVGKVVERRGQIFRCTWNVSDPRHQGTGVTLISADIADDDSAVVWAQDVTWNDGGTWVGRVTGTKDAAGVHWLTLTSVGTGAYVGLRYSDTESGPGDTWPVNGRIEPIEAGPTPAATLQSGLATPIRGTGTCHEVLAATPEGPSHVRAWVFDCSATSSDTRVAGRQLVLVNADVHADGTASLWGTTVLWNAQGTWDGSWAGGAGPGWPGGARTWSGTLVGSEAFRGLTYRVVTTTNDGLSVVTAGSVDASD